MSPTLRFTTRYLFGDMPTSRTEYIYGRNTRSESRNCAGHSSTTPPTNVQYKYGPWVVYIHNRDLGYSFWIDMERGIYAAYRANEFGSPAWAKPRISPLKPSGKTLHVHTDTIDTGDRKSVFGSTARRVITRSRQLRDSELASESECDGWYIDAPAAWVNLHPPNARTFCVLSCTSDGTRDEFKFTETGTRETGFLVQARHTHRSFFQGRHRKSKNPRNCLPTRSHGVVGEPLRVPAVRPCARLSASPSPSRSNTPYPGLLDATPLGDAKGFLSSAEQD